MNYLLRKYNTAASISFPLIDWWSEEPTTSATFVAADCQISKDDGSFANSGCIPWHVGNGIYAASFSATEMQAKRVVIVVQDQTASPDTAWMDQTVLIDTYGNDSGQHAFDLDTATQNVTVTSMGASTIAASTFEVDAIDAAAVAASAIDASAVAEDVVDLIWDEVLTSGTHDVNYSAGQRLRYLVLTAGAASSGGNSTITLAAGESSIDNVFNENIVSVVSGTAAGQTRSIVAYNGTTKVATVDKAWSTNPETGDVYEILPFSSLLIPEHGTATAGANDSITLAATASTIDDTYIGSVVYISAGTGAGQVRLITDYAGDTKVATITDNWTTNPTTDSVYKILPVGRTVVSSVAAAGANTIADHTIRRTFQNACDSTDGDAKTGRSLLGAIAKLVNKLTSSGGTLTIYEDDDSTSLFTQTVTTDGDANPITQLDTD